MWFYFYKNGEFMYRKWVNNYGEKSLGFCPSTP